MESIETCQCRPSRGYRPALEGRQQVVCPSTAPACLVTDTRHRLLDYKTQERYYTKIVERYMAFCSDAGKADELLRRLGQLSISTENGKTQQPPPSSTPGMRPSNIDSSLDAAGQKDLAIIMMAMRKLREGIVASSRVDNFSIQAYIFCIRLSILVKNMESYQPAILHLLKRMHAILPLSKAELQEFVGYLVLDLACRQNDLAEAYVVRQKYRLHDAKVDAILQALAHDNYFMFWKIRRSVDGHKAKLMEFAEEGITKQALKCLGRSYLSIDLPALEEYTNSTWYSLTKVHGVGWQLEGTKVVIRKPKTR